MVEGKHACGYGEVNGVRYRFEKPDGSFVAPGIESGEHSSSESEGENEVETGKLSGGCISVPVFYPEEAHTRGPFEDFITLIEPVLERFGIGKVVPPPGWSPCSTASGRDKGGPKRQRRESSGGGELEVVEPGFFERRTEILRERADDLVIEKAIRQHATGRKGVYRTVLVEQKPMHVGSQFKPLADSKEKQPPRKGEDGFDLDAIERHFWKNVTYQPPLYGADVEGSLFDELREGEETTFGRWDIRNLDTILSKVLYKFINSENAKREKKEKEKASQKKSCDPETKGKRKGRGKKKLEIPGVISPYLYFGMYRSFFAWHTEDVDLYSVNYLHFGAPKVWYCVPPRHRRKFESAMRSSVPELFMHCSEFLRHKELLASPAILKAEAVPLVKFVQRENEWVINFPGAYHAGFNCGFNCAESTNFATQKWIEIGAKAKPCECSKDSVRLDMKLFEDFELNDAPVPLNHF